MILHRSMIGFVDQYSETYPTSRLFLIRIAGNCAMNNFEPTYVKSQKMRPINRILTRHHDAGSCSL
jgi:hypothetical protein